MYQFGKISLYFAKVIKYNEAITKTRPPCMKGSFTMKKLFALLIAVLLMVSMVACGGKDSGSDLEYIQKKGKLVVGITDYAPMDYKDENGEWIGFDADFAKLFAEELGVECEFLVLADWGQRFNELNSKNIDVIWNGKEDRGRFSVLTKGIRYAILKQGDVICQEEHESNQKPAFIM